MTEIILTGFSSFSLTPVSAASELCSLDRFPVEGFSSEFTLILLPVSAPVLLTYGFLPVADKGLFTAPSTPAGFGFPVNRSTLVSSEI